MVTILYQGRFNNELCYDRNDTNYDRILLFCIGPYYFLHCRELLWHSFIELLTSVLPTINIHELKSWIVRKVKLNNTPQKKLQSEHRELFQKTPTDTVGDVYYCEICRKSPVILPCTSGCEHKFCYYCIAANLDAVGENGEFLCPACGVYLKKNLLVFLTANS